MKTPRKKMINILGTEIPIEIDDEKCKEENADGLYLDGKIILKSVYEDKKHYKRVFFHECFHALCYELGCQLDHNMEETLAHTVSTMFSKEF